MPTVMAAGPVYGGNMTRPHRLVVLRWDNGQYSVHTEYMDELGGFESGSYFVKEQPYIRALSLWHTKLAEQQERYAPYLLADWAK